MAAGTALITGGSGGIGRACAAELVDAGYAVTLVARSTERLRAAAAETGASSWLTADSTTEDGVATIAAGVDQLDVCLHVAGVNTDNVPLRETTLETFDQVIAANLRSAFLLAKAILPKMARGGRLIFIGSTSAARGLPGFGAYAASKGGLRALAGTLAGEVGREGINVTVLTPGPVDTEMFDTGPRGVPLLDPRDVGRAARFLAELDPTVTVEELTMRANRHHGAALS